MKWFECSCVNDSRALFLNSNMVLTRYPRALTNLPLLNLVVSGTALTFQVTVLYPWHKEIDESHARLVESLEKQLAIAKKNGKLII